MNVISIRFKCKTIDIKEKRHRKFLFQFPFNGLRQQYTASSSAVHGGRLARLRLYARFVTLERMPLGRGRTFLSGTWHPSPSPGLPKQHFLSNEQTNLHFLECGGMSVLWLVPVLACLLSMFLPWTLLLRMQEEPHRCKGPTYGATTSSKKSSSLRSSTSRASYRQLLSTLLAYR